MMRCGGMEDVYDQEVMNEKTVSFRGMGVLPICPHVILQVLAPPSA